MSRRSIPLLLAALLLAAPAAGQDAPALSIETLKTVTETLSSDAYEGRAPTTPAEAKTTDYIVARFKAAGLQPGKHGSWFQDVPPVQITPGGVAPTQIGKGAGGGRGGSDG